MIQYPFANEQPVTQEYGENPGDYARFGMLAHNGIDFGCPGGTNVLACAEGQVERADFDDGGYGWFIQIKHAEGLTSVYGHLSQIRVQAHSMVRAGQLIGQSGSSGNSTGPHLHFEVRRAGLEKNGYWGAIDPRPLIAWPGSAPVSNLPAVTYQVKAAMLNIRSGAGVNNLAVGQLHVGDEVQVVEVVTPEAWGKLADGRYIALVYQGSELAVKK